MNNAKRRSPRVDNALLDAAIKGDLTALRERIAKGANVNAGNKERYPPLFLAAAGGHMEVVRELIQAGADVNQVAKARWEVFPSSALVTAIRNDRFEIAEALIQAGAKLELETYPENNAASEAALKASGCHCLAGRGLAALLGRIAKVGSREHHREASQRWMQIVRDAVAQGVRIREYCLWEAIKLNDEELALLLIEAGVNPDVAPHMTTALQMALLRNQKTVALALIRAGADVNRVEQLAPPPLLQAVGRGDIEVVRALIEAGVNLNVVGSVVVGESQVPAFRQEEDSSISLNVRGLLSDPSVAQASTALVVAVRRADHEMVKLLVDHGADVNLGDERGRTPLGRAENLGLQEIAETLRRANSQEPTCPEGSPAAALHAAAEHGDVAKVRQLLAQGVNPNSPIDDLAGRRFPLHVAAKSGRAPVVALLLEAGGDVNATARVELTVSVTPLMLAAQEGHEDVLRLLLAGGADLPAKDKEVEGGGETALHYAAHGGSSTAIRCLVEAGARVDAKARGQITPLMNAVMEQHIEAAQALIAAGADVNANPNDGAGPLWQAAYRGDGPMVRLLLAKGARPIPAIQKPYALPLDAAASQGSIEVVRLLLEAGAPVNAVLEGGASALASAVLFGHVEIVELLLNAGADPNLADHEGVTPLMLAVRLGREAIFHRLMAAGGDLNLRNHAGQTCLDLAHQSGRRSMLALVRAAGGKSGSEPDPRRD